MPWILHIHYEEYVVYGLVMDCWVTPSEHFVSFKFHFDEMMIMFALYLYQYVTLVFYSAGIDLALYGFIMYVYLLSIYTIKID